MSAWQTNPNPLRRWLDAFVALPGRLRLPLSIVLALLLHGLLLVVIWVAPLVVRLLHLDTLFPSERATSVTAVPAATPKPKRLEMASMEVKESLKVPPEKPAAAPPPPAAPLTAAEEAQLQKLFEQLPVEEQQQYIDVEGLAKQKNLSKRALFESWRDSVAGSRQPGKNNEPLPSQDGRTDIPFAGFKNQQANTVDPKTFEESEAAKGRGKPIASVKFPGLEAPPIYKPRPVTKADLAPNPRNTASTAAAAPTPPPPPKPVAPPRPVSDSELAAHTSKAEDNTPMRLVALSEKEVPLFILGLATPKLPRISPVALQALPTPQPTPKPTPAPAVAPRTPAPTPPARTPPPVDVAKMTTQEVRPSPIKDPNYASHMEKKKTEGSGPLGEGGVDAIATERGKYKKMMKMMVESRWLPAVRSRGDLIQTGTVSIRFTIDGKGRLVNFKVDYNSSNNAHAMVVEEAMRATKFEAPPPEMLRSGVFEDEFSFTLY